MNVSPQAIEKRTFRIRGTSNFVNVCNFSSKTRWLAFAIILAIYTFGVIATPRLALGQEIVESPLRQSSGSSVIERIVQSTNLEDHQARTLLDDQVIQTSFERTPTHFEVDSAWNAHDVAKIRSVAPSISKTSGKKLNFVEREKSNGMPALPENESPKKENIGPLIANIGMNLAIVLFAATSIVVIAKHWMKPKPAASSQKTRTLEVEEVLTLDENSMIRVIQWQNTHILIASDDRGIRSVVPLASSFLETMEHVEAEATIGSTESDHLDARNLRTSAASTGRATTTATRKSKEAPNAIDDRLIHMLLDTATRTASKQRFGNEGVT